MTFHSFLSRGISVVAHNTDVSDRDKVLEVMKKEFGDTNVVPISNYNLLKVKSLVKDLSKFYGIPFEDANRATQTVEFEVRKATIGQGEDKNLFVLTYEDANGYLCTKHNPNDPQSHKTCMGCSPECNKIISPSFHGFIEKYPEVGASMNVLFKQNRSLGRHAGGVLVCDDLMKKMPLIVSGGDAQAPWCEGMNVKHLEKIGNFIKYDLLGLSTLRLFERTIQLISQKELVQVNVGGVVYKLRKDDKVKLTNGEYIIVRDLKPGHDIVVPIEVIQ